MAANWLYTSLKKYLKYDWVILEFSIKTYDLVNDGVDFEGDGLCDAADLDDDDDGCLDVDDADDADDNNTTVCSDNDLDTCDDCANGIFDIANDGFNFDGDGDGDGVPHSSSSMISTQLFSRSHRSLLS